ncbi:HEAT repeat domain-containing protein [Myxococcota bacterium]
MTAKTLKLNLRPDNRADVRDVNDLKVGLKSENPAERQEAIERLGDIGSVEAVKLLRDALRYLQYHRCYDLRFEIIRQIAKVGSDEAVRALELLEDSCLDRNFGVEVVRLLGNIRSENAIDTIIKLVNKRSCVELQLEGIAQLKQLNDPAILSRVEVARLEPLAEGFFLGRIERPQHVRPAVPATDDQYEAGKPERPKKKADKQPAENKMVTLAQEFQSIPMFGKTISQEFIDSLRRGKVSHLRLEYIEGKLERMGSKLASFAVFADMMAGKQHCSKPDEVVLLEKLRDEIGARLEKQRPWVTVIQDARDYPSRWWAHHLLRTRELQQEQACG